jgi:glutaminyl-peptide cyclotransferase
VKSEDCRVKRFTLSGSTDSPEAPSKGKKWKVNLSSIIFLVLGLAACQQKVNMEIPQVLNTYLHDTEAFTQGLLYFDGKLYESTGLNGRSSLREVDIKTGNVIRILPMDSQYFAEGLARVGNKLIQITWQNGEAFIYDLETFNKEKTFSYQGQGWGICYEGKDLYMSDGSSTLFKRNAETFEIISQVQVKLNDQAIDQLNELECVDDFIYSNVWQTDRILKINKKSGVVVSEIDASGLLSPEERQGMDPGAVLNGIAYNAEHQSFYITGKLWPKLFEVTFVEK